MVYCIKCGKEVRDGAKFCGYCGTPVHVVQEDSDESTRKIVYEGKIHKCPNCGEIINSFEAYCSACGLEIRDSKPSSMVKELAEKLQEIEAKQMPRNDNQKSVMKSIFGRDLKNKEEEEEAELQFRHQKENEKIELITNFPIPNTKEDILDFMILASSNMRTDIGLIDGEAKAWYDKMGQVYKRAEISMKNTSSFSEIKEIYFGAKREVKRRKVNYLLFIFGCFILANSIFGIMLHPILVILIAGPLFVIIFMIYRKYNR